MRAVPGGRSDLDAAGPQCGEPGGEAETRASSRPGPPRRARGAAGERVCGVGCSCQQAASAAAAGSVVPNSCSPSRRAGSRAPRRRARARASGWRSRAARSARRAAEPAFRDLQGAVGADLPQQVPHRGVAEPLDQVVSVRRPGPARRRAGSGRPPRQGPDQPFTPVGRHDVGDRRATRGRSEVGQGRVGPVEQPQLRELVRRDVRRRTGRRRAPSGGRGRRRSPPAPTAGTARRRRALVAHAERAAAAVPVRVGRGGHDPVDDRGGEGDRRRPSSRGPSAGPASRRPRRSHGPHRASAAPLPAMLSQDTTLDRSAAGPHPRGEPRGQPADDRGQVSGRRRPSPRGRRRAGGRGVEPAGAGAAVSGPSR